MDSENRQNTVKKIGLYLVVLLVILRFFVYPIHGAVERKKEALGELRESFRMKQQLLERKDRTPSVGSAVVTRDALVPYLYDSRSSYSQIQAEVIEDVMKLAEQKGMTVLNFEMPETTAGKRVSKVSVQIRLSGKPAAFNELLRNVAEAKKILSVESTEINTFGGQELSYMLVISTCRIEK